MTDEPAPEQGEPTDEQVKEDPFEKLRRGIADFAEYDEIALEQYRSFSFYFAMREQGMTRAGAQAMTCDRFGHDAPRGLCRRCGLGVDLTKTEESREKRRWLERDEWLASRH